MSMAPRNPEIKHNLGISNGSFGTLLSLAGLGSLISLIYGGHLVHRLGTRRVLTVGSTIVYATIASIPHVHSPIIFVVLMFIMGASLSGYHIASNAQGLRRQADTGQVLIPKLHGAWSSGALFAAVFAFIVTPRVSFAWHIDSLITIAWIVTQIALWNLKDVLIHGSKDPDSESSYSFKTIFTSFQFEPLVSFGLLCAVMIEFATNDWATIFAKEEIGMSPAASILPYILFVLSMIIGRFTIHRVLTFRTERWLIKWGAIFGGSAFICLSITGTIIAKSHKQLGFAVILIGFIAIGTGCSHLAPTWYGIAGRRTSVPGAVIVAQLGVVNTILVFLIKILISWLAQTTWVLTALLFPALMLIAVVAVSHLGRDELLPKT